MAKQWTLLPADSKVAPPVQGLASVITSSFVPESFNAGSNGGSILSFELIQNTLKPSSLVSAMIKSSPS